MRSIFLFLFMLLSCQLNGQVAFEEQFENFATGLDLTAEGYQLSLNPNYEGSVSAIVAESNANKFARMVSTPNGGANMQILKTIDIQAGKTYRFEINTKGPFKRQLIVYSTANELLNFSTEYKPAVPEEETAWKKLSMTFMPGAGIEQVKIGLYHNWSGTIDLDSIKVYEITRQTAYYLSSTSGNDDKPGTKEAPWKSLAKISSVSLFPGDTVLFKRGDIFKGHFIVNGSGDTDLPLLITSYGEGKIPIITGQVGTSAGGDFEEAILVENKDNMIFDGLEIHNERLASRSGVNDVDAYGIQVINSGTKAMHNLVFRNMIFKDVYAVQPILDPDDFDAIQVSGLRFISSRNTEAGKEKNINGILVEDCYFGNLQRFGIQFKHNGGDEGIGNDSINRNMNIICRNNEFYYNGGTGILPNRTYNCLIENNIFDHPGASTDSRMPGRGSSVWNYKAINTIVQYNMCLSTRGYLDSHGIHIDNWNENTFVQYNYMEDCEGGFVEILKGNISSVYRFNVSVNDGWRKNPNWTDSNHTIWVNADRWGEPEDFAPSDGVYIYNNTVVIDSAFTTSINMDGKNMFVYNNIFSSTNGAGMGAQNTKVRDNETPFYMSNNLFEGNVHPDFVSLDEIPQQGDPLFSDSGCCMNAYQLLPQSPALDNGAKVTGPRIPGAGQGIFANIPSYPDTDLFGNPIDLSSDSPNIGACNVKYAIDTSIIVDTTIVTDTTALFFHSEHQDNSWHVYPQPASSTIYISSRAELKGITEISLCNLKGQVVHTQMIKLLPSDNELVLDIESSLPNGIYFLNIKNKNAFDSRRIVLYR